MAKLNSGSVWQQSKYCLSTQTERSCYVCYCVLSVRSSQTRQQQQRRVKKKKKKWKELQHAACFFMMRFLVWQRTKKTFPLFYNYHLCALDIVSLHSCHLCCVNMSQLMFRQTSIEIPGFLGFWLCAVSVFYLYTNAFGKVNEQRRAWHCAYLSYWKF